MTPSSRATWAIGKELSITFLAACSLNSGVYLFGCPDISPVPFRRESYWIPCPGTVGHLKVIGGFPDGVYFVALAPVGNPELVLSSVAQGIGLRDLGDRPLLDRLRSHLENTRVLILLDNFEHLIAAPVVAHILQATVSRRSW